MSTEFIMSLDPKLRESISWCSWELHRWWGGNVLLTLEMGSPWLHIGPQDPSYSTKGYAIWISTGAVHGYEDTGAVTDDPIYKPEEGKFPGDWLQDHEDGEGVYLAWTFYPEMVNEDDDYGLFAHIYKTATHYKWEVGYAGPHPPDVDPVLKEGVENSLDVAQSKAQQAYKLRMS